MDTMENLIWFFKQDFRTVKRFFKFMEPFLMVMDKFGIQDVQKKETKTGEDITSKLGQPQP